MKKLMMVGNNIIDQFEVTESGIYAWRNKLIPQSEWIFGHCDVGDKIEDQYEGCGPLTWEAVGE